MGIIYVDQDVVVDGDLVTGRSGGHCHQFAHEIIDILSGIDSPNAGPQPIEIRKLVSGK
jgi:hypothetical protein